eukprot:scaffold211840_cov31-Tisochrysis_lutea.AAC.2
MFPPRSTSGAVQAGAPTRAVCTNASRLRCARPKSHTLARPERSNNTLALFKSRCSTGGWQECR